MDSPTTIPLPDESWSEADKQAYFYLTYNQDFIAEIETIKQMYDVSGWQADPENPNYAVGPPPKDKDYFYFLIDKVCHRITLPGNWFPAIFKIIIGEPVERSLRPDQEVHTIISDQGYYVELRVYGNAGIAELREAARKLRSVVKQKYEIKLQVRDKPQFDKYKRAYELRRRKENNGTRLVAEKMSTEFPDEIITPTDVSSFDNIVQREIEASFASEAAFKAL